MKSGLREKRVCISIAALVHGSRGADYDLLQNISYITMPKLKTSNEGAANSI
jgi:hypothetical protein